MGVNTFVAQHGLSNISRPDILLGQSSFGRGAKVPIFDIEFITSDFKLTGVRLITCQPTLRDAEAVARRCLAEGNRGVGYKIIDLQADRRVALCNLEYSERKGWH